MRKTSKRIHLSRETLLQLERSGLKNVAGGTAAACSVTACNPDSNCRTCTIGRCCPP